MVWYYSIYSGLTLTPVVVIIAVSLLTTVGDRTLPVTGSRLWNGLPADVTSATTIAVFHKRLKIHLFSC